MSETAGANRLSTSSGHMLEAVETFAAVGEGEQITITKGVSRVAVDHWIVKRYSERFKPVPHASAATRSRHARLLRDRPRPSMSERKAYDIGRPPWHLETSGWRL